MRRFLITAALCLQAAGALAQTPTATDKNLWYTQPATIWEETLPLGNGRLGMMPDGGVTHEHIVLNEITMWSGCEADYSNPEAAKCLPEIRRLLLDGRNKEAQDLMYEQFVPVKPTTGGTYGTSQILADLWLDFPVHRHTDYSRRLDLDEAVAYTSFSSGGIDYRREYFVPRGSDFMVVHMSAQPRGSITFDVRLSRAERADLVSATDTTMVIGGNLDSGREGVDGMAFRTAIRVIATGADAATRYVDGRIRVTDADEAWIVIDGETDYWGPLDADRLAAINDLTVDDIYRHRREGICDYRLLFGSAGLYLPRTGQSALPTDERIMAFAENDDDPELAALYFNYGRYLLICSTLPGNLPPNLQGLWTNGCSTPWNGDYHTNINVQMNHWPVEITDLAPLHEPLIELVKRSVPSGERTARAFYGENARGWVMHMMTNPWGYTEPGEKPSWGATNTGGAWLCAHLWQHYMYMPPGEDALEYLREIYPVMKGAADFFMSIMVTEPTHGWLVTGPSSSPENAFRDPLTGEEVSICMAPTMDIQILTELFGNVAAAADILGIDAEYAAELRGAVDKFPPMSIGSDGRLMEWLQEYEEVDPHHRHVSHLYGLHPASLITIDATPDLAEGCRLSLERRGDGGTGWSRAWKINFWARLHDGDRAYTLLRALLQPAWSQGSDRHVSGTFPNLFCSHPPFQMDGNWGGTSGIAEMLLQTSSGDALFLPALPSSWPDGAFRGFSLPGGRTASAIWRDGRPVFSEIK